MTKARPGQSVVDSDRAETYGAHWACGHCKKPWRACLGACWVFTDYVVQYDSGPTKANAS